MAGGNGISFVVKLLIKCLFDTALYYIIKYEIMLCFSILYECMLKLFVYCFDCRCCLFVQTGRLEFYTVVEPIIVPLSY